MTTLLGDTGRVITGAKKTFAFTLATPFENLRGTPISVPNVGSQPGTAIDSYTVQASDFPTISPNPVAVHWTGFLVFGGKNTDSTARTLNYTINKNGSAVSGASNASFSATASQFYTNTIYRFYDIQIGDVLDLYLWCSASSLLNYDYLAFYIVPTNVVLSNAKILKDLVFNMNQRSTLTAGTPGTATTGSLFTYPTSNVTLNIGAGSVSYVYYAPAVGGLTFKNQYGADSTLGNSSYSNATNRPQYLNMYTPTSVTFRDYLG